MSSNFTPVSNLHQLPPKQFEEYALALFRHQAKYNAVYRAFLYHLKTEPQQVKHLEDIPFLPIRFFKTHAVQTGEFNAEAVFKSSSTTGKGRSQHAIPDLQFYRTYSQQLFELVYGKLQDYILIALLPSYQQQGDSSLVYMVEHFIKETAHEASGFYLHNEPKLATVLSEVKHSNRKILLLGVSFALLDLAESKTLQTNSDLLIMETGGMKGRRKELVRDELHEQLKSAFGVAQIHSEYGMTEMLTQAYAPANGVFKCPPGMKVLIRDINDPLHKTRHQDRGGLNVIDLANTASCAFIETEDLGYLHENGDFEVLGRFDNSDIRGCSLLAV